ncbi:ATP-binding cassette domain-containing protein [Adlercreutzia sp. R25]|uniref:ATP-binding cassette domain-containing protein n=1 Tax=Adlercreutzia shanghongiae TaxID=3111773 RepID=A0ABU6IVJ1_9ACTN|nr:MULTISPECIES: ATP-binding cassette domain-containing protein [unclassified Adlercreutzia]MEC4271985.1 ATP-binding cassette domain-containing protein [Adlercreutzia sp. R25]MEC4293716.1 ATP-binding cassette domain-containing protein [Adlercreutzia sp. R22]
MALLAFEHVTFRYPGAARAALREVNLAVEPGQFMVVCGPSGCGKTTLLRHLKPALAPHGAREGRVLFEGAPLEEVPAREQVARLGFVMQDPDAQLVTDSVWHELAFVLESLGCDQRTMRVRVAEMASYFGIQHWFHRRVDTLSGGQKQLLNLASAMVARPEVLVLDEPTAQLDPLAASDFLVTVHKINRELGTTVVMSEHRLEEAYALADRVVVMDAGRVVADGAPQVVAEALFRSESPMRAALPVPVRVCATVEESRADGRADALASETCGAADRLPLTVREGRAWLAAEVAAHPPTRRALPDDCAADAPSAPLAVELEGVWLRYERDGADVLKGTTLAVPEGSLFAVVGGNGTGKSTMLRALCGIARSYRGKITVLGRRLKDWKRGDLFHGGVALLPQDPQSLMAKKTVRDELEEMLAHRGLSAEQRATALAEVATATEIEPLLSAHPFDLSGGELQRAALAKVLLTRPRLLLLDEPTKGLDAAFKERLARIFRRLAARGTTVLMVSHDVEFCASFADACALFFDGGIVAADASRPFFASNSFYTTAASRMSRGLFDNAVTAEDVVNLCLS